MTEEEYIRFESDTEVPHEFINGTIRRVPEKSGLHAIAKGNLLYLLKKVKENGFRVLSSVIKLRIPGLPVYLYPDVFATNEPVPDIHTEHIFSSAILTATIYAGKVTAFDTIDKFIYYRQIPELHYYLLIEAEKRIIYLFHRGEQGAWATDVFIQSTDIINLPLLNIRFELQDLFE